MSTNPFRRSSLKGPGGSRGATEHVHNISAPIDIPYTGADTPTGLSLNTKVPAASQKHVNFASPPAIPISPVSYPPSPESTRISPAFNVASLVAPLPTDYSSAIQSDPFHADAERDENDGAIVQALENAKVNSAIVVPDLEASKQDAVKNTLSRFASAPKRPAVVAKEATIPAAQKPTMDVDAFKRLLLTGSSGVNSQQDRLTNVTVPSISNLMSDNSSGTDTASISQRSLFDQGPNEYESPRSSDELNRDEIDSFHQSFPPILPTDSKKKPAPPAPRHGRSVKEDNTPSGITDSTIPQNPSPMGGSRQPPAPPLARRRSQNTNTPQADSSRKSPINEPELTSNPPEASPRVPPPRRSRRPGLSTEQRSSSDLPTTLEENDLPDSPLSTSRKSSESRPPPPPARNSAKRVSLGSMDPPPLPPPRRARGSSRSSVESQRPPLNVILGNGPESTGSQSIRQGSENQRISSSSSAYDILADLAALQREVDEARRKESV